MEAGHCQQNNCSTSQSKAQGDKTIGLSVEIQERLLLDLKDFSGLSFRRICKFRPEYGTTNSNIRRSIQNKVNWYKILKREDIDRYSRLFDLARKNQIKRSSKESSGLVEAQFSSDSSNATHFDTTMRSWATTPQKAQKAAVTALVAKKDTFQGLGSPLAYGSPSASSTSTFSKQKDPTELFSSYEEAEAYGMLSLVSSIQCLKIYGS